MKSIASSSYGPLEKMRLTELPPPTAGKGRVLVRVHASSLNPADYKVVMGKLKFLHGRKFPLVVGYDFSGVVEEVGPRSGDFKKGDEVFGFLAYGPGNNQGAFAELITAKASEIARKPKGVSHAQAASSATSALTVLQSLRNIGRIQPGHSVLVTGASGGVGSLGVWIAKKLGANVTAVGSGPGLELAKKLGASATIDRKKEDIFAPNRGAYDIVFDAAGFYRWKQWKSRLNPGGAFVTTLPSLGFALDKVASLVSGTRVGLVMVKSRASDLQDIARWLGEGFQVPVDSVVPVRDVAAGIERLRQGTMTGKIAVDVATGF